MSASSESRSSSPPSEVPPSTSSSNQKEEQTTLQGPDKLELKTLQVDEHDECKLNQGTEENMDGVQQTVKW